MTYDQKTPSRTAEALHCASCGAAVSGQSAACEHCGARLATIGCPCCFGMMFLEARFCPHCGAAAAKWQNDAETLPCPACATRMLRGTLANVVLHECPGCFGIWLDNATFEGICRQAERQAALLGSGRSLGQPRQLGPTPVRYRRCPLCQSLMNRVNFARCSGVVVDVCGEHGMWFDVHELHHIVHFIQAGGLEKAREMQKAELAEQARRLEHLQLETGKYAPFRADEFEESATHLSKVVGASAGLLRRYLRRRVRSRR